MGSVVGGLCVGVSLGCNGVCAVGRVGGDTGGKASDGGEAVGGDADVSVDDREAGAGDGGSGNDAKACGCSKIDLGMSSGSEGKP